MALPQAARWIKELRASLEAASLYLVPRGGVILWHGASNAVPKGWAICDGTNGTPDLRDRFVIGAGGKYGLDATGGAASATPEVSTGTAKTGIRLADAAPGGTAGSAKAGISIQDASVSITTGSAKAGVTLQHTTLDENTLPSHGHSATPGRAFIVNDPDANVRWDGSSSGDKQNLWGQIAASGASLGHAHGVSDPGHTHAVSSDKHTHGVTDPTHTHTVTTAAHNHTLTDGGHSHTVTAKAISTLPPFVALFYIKKL